MTNKILVLVFMLLFVQFSSCLSLQRHDDFPNTCFYLPLRELQTDPNFKFTITRAWTPEQAGQLKSGALNTSDFIKVQGWIPLRAPNKFFTDVARQGPIILHKLKYIKNIVQGSDAPQYGLSTPDLEFAFGNPSKAVLYQVPQGKALIALRFQASVSSNPFIGRWSVLVDLADEEDLEFQLRSQATRVLRQSTRDHLTPLDVARSLNIIPAFIESSIFWTLSSSPPQGTTGPVSYQAFLVVIRGGQEVLAGPIHDGQYGVIQVKDVVKERSSCLN